MAAEERKEKDRLVTEKERFSLERDKLIAECKKTERELDLQRDKLELEEKRTRDSRELEGSKMWLQLVSG